VRLQIRNKKSFMEVKPRKGMEIRINNIFSYHGVSVGAIITKLKGGWIRIQTEGKCRVNCKGGRKS